MCFPENTYLTAYDTNRGSGVEARVDIFDQRKQELIHNTM